MNHVCEFVYIYVYTYKIQSQESTASEGESRRTNMGKSKTIIRNTKNKYWNEKEFKFLLS